MAQNTDKDAAAGRSRGRGRWVKIALLIASSALTILSLEFALRLSGAYPCRPSQDEGLFECHPVYGWRFIPGKRARVVQAGEYEGTVQINSAGMREGECVVEKPEGTRRIAVLGDSFVSNLDVDAADVFTEVMETLLPPSCQVLNFGVNGFSPVQEYLLLKDLAVRYRPDVVLMVVYLRNDFDDNQGTMDWIKGYARPKARIASGGELIIESAPSSSPERPESAGDWGKDEEDEPLTLGNAHTRLLLYHFVRDRLFYRFNVFLMPEIRMCAKSASPETTASYSLMEKIIGEFAGFCRMNGIEPVVVVAPTIVQVYDDLYWARMVRKYRLPEKEYDLFKPNRFILDACRRRGVHSLDLTPALRRHAQAGERIYYPHNQHWNRAGNRIVAEAICGYLSESGLLDSRNPGSPGSDHDISLRR